MAVAKCAQGMTTKTLYHWRLASLFLICKFYLRYTKDGTKVSSVLLNQLFFFRIGLCSSNLLITSCKSTPLNQLHQWVIIICVCLNRKTFSFACHTSLHIYVHTQTCLCFHSLLYTLMSHSFHYMLVSAIVSITWLYLIASSACLCLIASTTCLCGSVVQSPLHVCILSTSTCLFHNKCYMPFSTCSRSELSR